jgi:O-antigen ligase
VIASENAYNVFYSSIFTDLIFSAFLVPILQWNIKDYKQIRYIISIILFTSIAQILLAYLQAFIGPSFYFEERINMTYYSGSVGIPVGTFKGSGNLAEYVLLSYCLVIGAIFSTKYMNKAIGMTIMSAAFLIVIICSSRSVLLAMFIAPILVLILLSKKGFNDWRIIFKPLFLFISIVCLLFIIIIRFFPDSTTHHIREKFTDEASDYHMGLLGMRGAINLAAFDMFLENPIIGTGFESFAKISAPYVREYGVLPGHEYQNWEAHNMYTKNIVENGLFGFFLFLGILRSGFINFMQSFDNITNNDLTNMIIFSGFFIYYILQLFNMFFGYGLYYNIMFILGISAAMNNLNKFNSC